jgi:hypothetical protein
MNDITRSGTALKSRFGPLTALTIVLLAVFGVVDAGAHFTKYKYGETFSAFIWWLLRKLPVMRVVIGAAIAVLFTHLEFQVP